MAEETRDNHGRYSRNIDTAERDAECARLRRDGLGVTEIAKRVGYGSVGSVSKAIERAMMATVQEAGEAARALELEKLDSYIRMALDVARTTHYAHSNGRVVMLADSDGVAKPLVDDGPVLAALDRLIRLSERRAKLKGLDAPIKHELLTMDATEKAI